VLHVFFHESSSPKPLKITLRSFRIFSKILRDICKSRCTTGVNNICGNFANGTAGAVDTGGKFAIGVKDTGGTFATGVNKTGGKLPFVSTTLGVNLPSVS
jgi:hypothetical protein